MRRIQYVPPRNNSNAKLSRKIRIVSCHVNDVLQARVKFALHFVYVLECSLEITSATISPRSHDPGLGSAGRISRLPAALPHEAEGARDDEPGVRSEHPDTQPPPHYGHDGQATLAVHPHRPPAIRAQSRRAREARKVILKDAEGQLLLIERLQEVWIDPRALYLIRLEFNTVRIERRKQLDEVREAVR